jgi:UDP-N-acetylglucosamine 2-epimerase (non-hydrolysing)
MKTYLCIMGTRPEIIKMAVLHRVLKEQGDRSLVLHTGQHEEMADVLYRFFGMEPDLRIGLKRNSPGLAHLTALLLENVDRVIAEVKPDAVVVQGDTTSAMVGALAAYYHGVPVAHVEAGLRTGERDPFPEEKNRELIGRLARWHFPPTAQTRQNLLNEGIPEKRVFEVGNTVIDAALWVRERLAASGWDAGDATPDALRRFMDDQRGRKVVLITAHRRENWGQPIRDIASAVGQLLAEHEDAAAVWPVHPNPRVRDDVETVLASLPRHCSDRICLTRPLDYPALMSVLARCRFALTDSGGIQEEASALARPVLITRNATERQELLLAGGARLVGTDVRQILEQSRALLTDDNAWRAMQLPASPFGDGLAASRIAGILASTTLDEQ